ncbi:hypothetical protein C8J57DRAFT_988245, partial [Mycena rebaudengoi]
AMFSGVKEGWIQFTPEFRPGSTFDQLTPEQRTILFIPSTNDCSEGMLGAFRVHMRYHPNSTAYSFTNQTRTERNNTEAFVKKYGDRDLQTYVMREVRKDGNSGQRAKFRRAWLQQKRDKAAAGRARLLKAVLRKKTAADRIAGTTLELDVMKLRGMSSTNLKAQLHVYR